MKTSRFSLSLLLSLFVLLAASYADAARVVQAKGKKVLINLEQLQAKAGDRFFIVTPQGKRMGILQIRQVKGQKALAQLLRGQARGGALLEPLQADGSTPSTGTAATPAPPSPAVQRAARSPLAVGGLLGLSMNSITATNVAVGSSEISATLTGTSFAFGAMVDYTLMPALSVRVMSGLESLEAGAEEESPIDNKPFNVTVNYLGLSMLGRYHVLPGTYNVWVGGGFTTLMVMGEASSNLINTKDLSFSTAFPLAAGVDIQISPTMFVPIQFEYNIWPAGEKISTSTMVFRGGFAIRF